MRLKLCILVCLSLAFFTRAGQACGLSPPIGPNGLPTTCHGDDAPLGFRIGVTGGGTKTKIDFDGEEAKLLQGAAVATFDVYPTERLALSATFGAALGGHLDFRDQRYDLLPGVIGGLGVSYRLFGGRAPFVHTSLTLSLASAQARAPDGTHTTFTSRDVRLGVAVGKAFGKVAAPFVVVRGFGAGTSWEPGRVTGADAFLYHVGVGSAFALSSQLDVLLELAFLGEQRATLGVGYAF